MLRRILAYQAGTAFGKDHLAVAPDMRGYNLSGKPAEVDQYQVKYLIEDVRALAASSWMYCATTAAAILIAETLRAA